MITRKQLEYIHDLSTGDDANEWDVASVKRHLAELGKESLEQLSKKEASQLTEKLLARVSRYEHVCGRISEIPRSGTRRYYVFGELEACLHSCPIGLDPNSCKKYRNCDMEP